MKEYSENNPGSERASTAIARMNAIHAVYSDEISNADMLYTISLFITEPMAWIDRYSTAVLPSVGLSWRLMDVAMFRWVSEAMSPW